MTKAIRMAAGRVTAIRDALVGRVGEAPWLPPTIIVDEAEPATGLVGATDSIPRLVLELQGRRGLARTVVVGLRQTVFAPRLDGGVRATSRR